MPQAAKLESENERANEALDRLRTVLGEIGVHLKPVAQAIKALGDELEAKDGQIDDAKNEMDEALARVKEMEEDAEADSHILAEWREAIEDHRRGLVDTDELYAKTVDA